MIFSLCNKSSCNECTYCQGKFFCLSEKVYAKCLEKIQEGEETKLQDGLNDFHSGHCTAYQIFTLKVNAKRNVGSKQRMFSC